MYCVCMRNIQVFVKELDSERHFLSVSFCKKICFHMEVGVWLHKNKPLYSLSPKKAPETKASQEGEVFC